MNTAKEPLQSQMLKALADSLRLQAALAETLALACQGGDGSDMLKPSDVATLLNCGATKARGIVRAHGVGTGKMGRIRRDVLLQKQLSNEL